MMKDLYRETGTIFRRSPLASPEGEGFASRVRAVVADHARQLQGTLARVKREGGRFTQGAAGKKRTTLPGGVIVETWINPNGLIPTLMAKVYYPTPSGIIDGEPIMIGFYHLLDDVAVLYETEYLLSNLPQLVGVVDDQRKLPAPITITTACHYRPDQYSGLLRLFMQAKRAVDLETTITDWHRDTGLVRSPDGVYWFIFRNRTSGTLTAKKGRIAPEYGDTLDQYKTTSQSLSAGSFIRQYAESQYLAGMEVDPSDSGTVILTDSRLVNGTDPSLPDQNTQWMSWSFQRRGKTDEHLPRVRWLHNESGGWHPFPRYGQTNPVYMLTCRVDFTFPTLSTIAATITQEASDEMSWVWTGWTGTYPEDIWEWPGATWYDWDGNVKTIWLSHDTNITIESSGLCKGASWPPSPAWDESTWPYVSRWTSPGTCITSSDTGGFGYKILTGETEDQEIAYRTIEGETTMTLYPSSWTYLSGSVYSVDAGPAANYTEIEHSGKNTLWRQLRADAAYFIQRDYRKRTYHYEKAYQAWIIAPAPYPYIYWSVLPWQVVDDEDTAHGWVIANDAIYELPQELVDTIVERLDSIGGSPGDFYAPYGWTQQDNLFVQFTQPTDPDLEWVRLSYDGQKIINNSVYNPIYLSTEDILTHPFLVDSYKKSIWVGAA